MPPKLRKDRHVSSKKTIPTPTTNKFEALADDPPLKDPPKTTTHDETTEVQPPFPTDPNYESMKNDISSMAEVLQSLTTSIQKMDKLDKIDLLESRQKSTDTKIDIIFTELRNEIDDIKGNTIQPPTTDPPSYADILKTSEKPNKNKQSKIDMTPDLEILKPTNKTPDNTNVISTPTITQNQNPTTKETPNENPSNIPDTNMNNLGHSKSTNQTPSHTTTTTTVSINNLDSNF